MHGRRSLVGHFLPAVNTRSRCGCSSSHCDHLQPLSERAEALYILHCASPADLSTTTATNTSKAMPMVDALSGQSVFSNSKLRVRLQREATKRMVKQHCDITRDFAYGKSRDLIDMILTDNCLACAGKGCCLAGVSANAASRGPGTRRALSTANAVQMHLARPAPRQTLFCAMASLSLCGTRASRAPHLRIPEARQFMTVYPQESAGHLLFGPRRSSRPQV